MDAVDQYLDKRYRDKGLIVPQIFGTQKEAPQSVEPTNFEIPSEAVAPDISTVAEIETPQKLNPQSRLALAGDDPLMRAIATEGI